MTITATATADSAGRAIIRCTGGTAPYKVQGYTTSNRWTVRSTGVLTSASANLLTAATASFESGSTTGWTNSNSTISTYASDYADGLASLLVTMTGTAGGYTVNMINTGSGPTTYGVAVTAGNTYTAVISAKAVSGIVRKPAIQIYWYTSGNAFIAHSGTAPFITLSQTAWTQLSVTAVAPATAARALIFITTNTGAASDTFLLDKAGIMAGSSSEWTPPGNPTISTHTDSDVHLNLPVYYDIWDATNTKVTLGPVVVASDTSILTDALYPGAGMRVNVISQKPNTWEARSQWFDILGRQDPLPVIGPLRYRSGTIRLRAVDAEDRAGILDMMASGRPLLLRMAVHDNAADDVFMLPTRITEDPVLDTYHAGPSVFSVDYQAVTRDIGPEWTNARTYATLTTESATYAALASAWVSYSAAAGGALP